MKVPWGFAKGHFTSENLFSNHNVNQKLTSPVIQSRDYALASYV